MSDLNSLTIQGRIVRNATFKILEDETKVAKFTIASNKMKKNKSGEYEKEAYFFPVSVFVSSASFAKFLQKGQRVIVEGFLRQDRWEKDGQKRTANNIAVRKIHLIFDSKKDGDKQTVNQSEEYEIEIPDEMLLEDEVGENELYVDDGDYDMEDIS